MNDFWFITMLGGVAGIFGTGLGGLAAIFVDCEKPKPISLLLEFAAGLMIGISVFDLLPSALEAANIIWAAAGLAGGMLITALLQKLIEGNEKIRQKRSGLLSCGIITLIGISMHNLFEGVAIGSGFAVSTGLGVSLLLVIALHDMPEGVALAAPLKGGGVSSIKIFLLAALSGVPTLIGAALGAAAGKISDDVVGFCLSVACGTMLYISFGDIIPASKRICSTKWQALADIFGLLTGFVFTKVF